MLPDRIFYPLSALVVAGLIALAIVYPQGQGDRSPGRFGHPPELQVRAAAEAQKAQAAAAAAAATHLK